MTKGIYKREVQLVFEHSNGNAKYRYLLINFLMVCQLARCGMIVYSVTYHNYTWFRFDNLSRLRHTALPLDPSMVTCLAGLFVFVLGQSILYHQSASSCIWPLAHQLAVVNTVQFRHSNIALLHKIKHIFTAKQAVMRPVGTIRKAGNLLKEIKHNKWTIRFTAKLTCLPYISERGRVRVVLLVAYLEAQLTVMKYVFTFIMLAFIIFHIPIMVQISLPLIASILTILDVIVTFYTCWNGFKVYLVPTFNQILITSVVNWLYGQVNCALEQRLDSIRSFKLQNQTPNLLATCDLVHFRRQHARLTGLVHATNDFYWSNGLLYFFCTNIPINVYMTTFLFYKRMTAVENLILYFIFMIQVCGLFFSVAIPARTCAFAHSCKRYLVAVQSVLSGQLLPLKLKYLSLYEQTNCSTRKITYSIGPATEITQRTLFEFIFTYVGFYLYAIRLFRS